MNSFKSSAPSGLPQSAQGRLRVRPGASVPLGYGGMPTGVVFSFAARELPRLAPALRFPVPPGGPSERYRRVLKVWSAEWGGGGCHCGPLGAVSRGPHGMRGMRSSDSQGSPVPLRLLMAPPCLTFRRGVVSLRGPGQSPVLPFTASVAAFCRPLRPVLLLVSFLRSRSPVVGVLGLCWMWQDVPFACQRRPVVGVLGLCWLLRGSFDCFWCPHTSVLRPSTTCLAVFPCAGVPGAPLLHALSRPSTVLCRRGPRVGSLGARSPARTGGSTERIRGPSGGPLGAGSPECGRI